MDAGRRPLGGFPQPEGAGHEFLYDWGVWMHLAAYCWFGLVLKTDVQLEFNFSCVSIRLVVSTNIL